MGFNSGFKGLMVKVKVTSLHACTGTEGVEIEFHAFVTPSARWPWVVSTTLRSLYPRERSGTHCIGRWVGPKAGLDGWGKSRLHWDSIRGPSRRQQIAVHIVCQMWLWVQSSADSYRVPKTPVVGKREQEVVAIVCLFVKSSLVVMFSRQVCTFVRYKQTSGLCVHSQYHSVCRVAWDTKCGNAVRVTWYSVLQVSPGTNINQLTNRGNSTTYKYSLGSLYSPQFLVHLCSTCVVGTVLQMFPWLLVQCTVTGVFVQYTSRRNSTTSIY